MMFALRSPIQSCSPKSASLKMRLREFCFQDPPGLKFCGNAPSASNLRLDSLRLDSKMFQLESVWHFAMLSHMS